MTPEKIYNLNTCCYEHPEDFPFIPKKRTSKRAGRKYPLKFRKGTLTGAETSSALRKLNSVQCFIFCAGLFTIIGF